MQKQYQLKLEKLGDSYGNKLVATSDDIKILRKFVDDNPPQSKYHYYIVVIKTTLTRININDEV